MKASQVVLLLVCLAVFTSTAQALSLWTQLTPAKLNGLPVAFQIEAKPGGNGQEFVVTVNGKDGRDLSPFLRGELKVTDAGGDIASTSVEGTRKGATVAYRFDVAARCLERSKFTFCELGHSQGRAMPSGDFYWFFLKDFVKGDATVPGAAKPAEGERMSQLGTVKVGSWQASVDFQFPEDDGKHYRVDVAISKPNHTPVIQSDRIDVWLLARNGKGVTATDRPRKGPLVEVNSAGTTADAVFFFASDVKREDLVAVVISVDGELHVFKVPAVKP